MRTHFYIAMKDKHIKIVDIARMSGVSSGTVDRVLHNRGRVSEEKRLKVEKVLKEINYEPNVAARVLASKKNYNLAAIVPSFTRGSYWELACSGMKRAAQELQKFHVYIDFFHFNQYDRNSFETAGEKLLTEKFDGVILATLFGEHVIELSQKLNKLQIPYVYIDSAIKGQNDLAYFGGDSSASGQIAAKLLLNQIGSNADIFFAYIKFKHHEVSVQMQTREEGFLYFLQKNDFKGNIHRIELDPDKLIESKQALSDLLNNKIVKGGIVFNSRIYELINILDKVDTELKENINLIGHDTIEANIEALKSDKVSFLISQRPDLQGYDAVKALGNFFLFGQTPDKVNYMPIDILMKENIDFYYNYKL